MAEVHIPAEDDSINGNAMPKRGPCKLVRDNGTEILRCNSDVITDECQIYFLWIVVTTAPMFVIALIIWIFVPFDLWFPAIVGVGVLLGWLAGFMDVNAMRNGG